MAPSLLSYTFSPIPATICPLLCPCNLYPCSFTPVLPSLFSHILHVCPFPQPYSPNPPPLTLILVAPSLHPYSCMPFLPSLQPLCHFSVHAVSIPAPPPLFFHSCSPIPASYPYPSVPAPKLSLLPLSFSSVQASPSLLLHSCFPLCSPILAPHPCSLSMLRVVKSSQLPAKIAAYLVSIDRLLCLAFLYRLFFLSKISLDWPLALTTQLSTSKLSGNPACSHRCSSSSASPSLLLCPFISIPAP